MDWTRKMCDGIPEKRPSTFPENRLIKVESLATAPTGSKRRLEFTYDHQSRRIKSKITNLDSGAVTSENKFLYDGWNLAAELNATNNAIIRSFVWGLDLSGSLQGAGGVGGLLQITYNGSATTNCFVAFDGNGNVMGLRASDDGGAVARYEYGAFGEVIRATGPMAKSNPFRFSSKSQDDETDLLYYGYRFYNASTGRWLSRDPITDAERDQGPNLLGFVRNYPLGLIDKDGRQVAPDWPILVFSVACDAIIVIGIKLHERNLAPGKCVDWSPRCAVLFTGPFMGVRWVFHICKDCTGKNHVSLIHIDLTDPYSDPGGGA